MANIMNKIVVRSTQILIKLGTYFLSWKTPELIIGAGAVSKLSRILKADNCQRVLIVTGPHIGKSDMLKTLKSSLENLGINYIVFCDLSSDPSDIHVENGVNLYNNFKADSIVIFGGGSPMDCGKAIAARIARPEKSVSELKGTMKVLRKTPTVYAIPTTAGTGSETTIATVITDSKTHIKSSINDLSIMPKVAILDPELTIGLSEQLTLTTGLDALCHAVECYIKGTYGTHLEFDYALKAIKLIYENLPKVLENGNDINARQNMLLGSFYAGRAFTRTGVGYVHAIGHAVGARYGFSHGHMMSFFLPRVLKAYGNSANSRLNDIARNIGLESGKEFIDWIDKLIEKYHISLGNIEMADDEIDQMAELIDREANPLYTCPQVWNRYDIKKFLRDCNNIRK